MSHVINYDLPNLPEQYVHRIGRTARAGKDGIGLAFCAEDERSYLKDIKKTTDVDFQRLDLPENFRAVVEGVGPTTKIVRKSKVKIKVKPKGRSKGASSERTKSKSDGSKKHSKRKGKVQRINAGDDMRHRSRARSKTKRSKGKTRVSK